METGFERKVRAYREQEAHREITFEELSQTPAFHQYLSNLLRSLTGASEEEMRLMLLKKDNPQNVRASRTDGKVVYLNIENETLQGFATLENKMFCCLGYLFHEAAYIRFYRQREEEEQLQKIKSGIVPGSGLFTPDSTEVIPYENLKTAVQKKENRRIIQQLYRQLASVVSDVQLETRLQKGSGVLVKKALQTMEEGLFSQVAALEVMQKDSEMSGLAILLSVVLQYARYGNVFVLRRETEAQSFYLKILENARCYLDQALEAETTEEKYGALTGVITYLWPYVQTVFLKESIEEASAQEEPEGKKEEKDGLVNEPEECEDCEDCDSCKPPKPDEDAEGEGGGECGEDGSPQAGDEVMKQIQKAVGSCGGDSFSDPPANIMRSGMARQAMEDAGGREDSVMEEPDNDPGRIIQRALQQMEEEILQEEAEELAAEELHSEALAKIRTGNVYSVHFGVRTEIQRAKVLSGDREYYEETIRKNQSFLKKIQREIERVVQEEETALQKHRYVGRRIDVKSTYKVDQRFFMKKRNPEKVIDLAVMILVDNSGSMEGKRMDSAREAAVLLTEALERLHIPNFVAGHSCESALIFQIFKNFDDSKYAKYSINRMFPGGDNRDGLALEVAGTYLKEREERQKLLIIISDGQPNSHGYSGELARKDIRSIVKQYQRDGIKTLAFAIGDDKPQIKNIYGESFIDISDYDKFPKILSKMIEKEILSAVR